MFYLTLYYDARKHKIKTKLKYINTFLLNHLCANSEGVKVLLNIRQYFNCKTMFVVIKRQLVQRKSMELQSGSLAKLTTKYLQPGIKGKMFITAVVNRTVGYDPGCTLQRSVLNCLHYENVHMSPSRLLSLETALFCDVISPESISFRFHPNY